MTTSFKEKVVLLDDQSVASDMKGKELFEGKASQGKALGPYVLSRTEKFHVFTCFLLIGTSAVLMWNNFINCIPSILEILYPHIGSFTDTVTATYFTGLCVTTFAMTFKPVHKSTYITIGLFGNILWSVIFYAICTYSTPNLISPLLHLMGFGVSVSVSVILSGCYSICSILPHPCIATLSAGVGFSGVASAASWSLLSYVAFPTKNVSNINSATLCLNCLGVAISATAVVYWGWLLQSSWVCHLAGEESQRCRGNWIHRYWRHRDFGNLKKKLIVDAEAPAPQAPLLKDYLRIVFELRGQFIARFVCYFSSYCLFPTIVPVGWKVAMVYKDVFIMLMQVLDFLGRYMTQLFPVLIVSELTMYVCLGLRCVFLPLFVVIAIYTEVPFLQNPVFQTASLIVFAFTYGWLATVNAVYIPRKCTSEADKMKSSAMGLFVAYASVFLSQWAGKLVKIIFKI